MRHSSSARSPQPARCAPSAACWPDSKGAQKFGWSDCTTPPRSAIFSHPFTHMKVFARLRVSACACSQAVRGAAGWHLRRTVAAALLVRLPLQGRLGRRHLRTCFMPWQLSRQWLVQQCAVRVRSRLCAVCVVCGAAWQVLACGRH